MWVQHSLDQEVAARSTQLRPTPVAQPPQQPPPSPTAPRAWTLPWPEPWPWKRPEPRGLWLARLGLLAVLLTTAPRVERCQLPETRPPGPQVGEVLLRAAGPGVDGAQGEHGGVRALEGIGLE